MNQRLRLFFNIMFLPLLLSACESGDSPEQLPDSPAPVVIERNQEIDISWTPVNSAVLYRVYWSTDENFIPGSATGFIETEETQFIHDQLGNGTTYFYTISAVNTSGEGQLSTKIAGTPVPPPGKPSSLAVSRFDTSLQAVWTQQAGIISYNLQISSSPDMADATIYTDAGNPFTIPDLVNGQSYFLNLQAVNNSGASGFSEPVTGTPSTTHAIAAGLNHSCTIRADRTLWCWGQNSFGQTGSGTFTGLPVTTATEVTTLADQTWESVSAGSFFTCAIDSAGALWCWGGGARGQLGIGSRNHQNTPTQVGESSNWKTVQAGAFHVCATQTDDTLWCWGSNSHGQIGNGQTGNSNDRLVPVQIGNETSWQALAPGLSHTCAIKSDRSLWCWGNMRRNTLELSLLIPTSINTDTDWSGVQSGAYHACATKLGGSLWCWGFNDSGQLGNNTAGLSAFADDPIQVGGNSDWMEFQGGIYHSCALKTDNSLWCWGFNSSGQFGNNSQTDSLIPVRIDSKSDWAQVALAGEYSCGANLSGDLFCWGLNYFGQLATGNEPRFSTQNIQSPALSDPETVWLDISSGNRHSCATKSDNSLYCWGANEFGQLGEGSFAEKAVPFPVTDIPEWQTVASSSTANITCAIKTDGSLWCWGEGVGGQFGNASGTDNYSNVPVKINDELDWIQVAAGYSHVCAIKNNNSLWCWGDNSGTGKLGLGNGADVGLTELLPRQVGAELVWSHVSAGGNHSCAIKTDNTLWCWGSNTYGQTGLGAVLTGTNIHVPTQVGTDEWASISVGRRHTCALKPDDTGWCWGLNNFNQASASTVADFEPAPVQIAGSSWLQLLAGYQSNCGIQTDQTLWCWGANPYGILGLANVTPAASPLQVGTAVWTDISIGIQHTCGLQTDGKLWCWGRNILGGLGDGRAWKLEPQPVTFP